MNHQQTNEQKYVDLLKKQAAIGAGLRDAIASGDGWTIKLYRERLEKINTECRELHAVVNNRNSGGPVL